MLLGSTALAAPLDPLAYSAIGDLTVASGTLTFDTDTLAVSGAFNGSGVLQSQGGGAPDIAVFDFSNINIASGVTITFQGSRPIALLSQGNATINSAITASGAHGGTGASGGAGGVGKLGGFGGGSAGGGFSGQPGQGPGGALPSLPGHGAAGGGFGGDGGHGGFGTNSNGSGGGGQSYGDLWTGLQGGSGGGGPLGAGVSGGGGAGGGAIEIGATGALALNGVTANGGGGGPAISSANGGGGGSGGGVILHGDTVAVSGTIFAAGGGGGSGAFGGANGGGGGGGGRVTVAQSAYTLGGGTLAVNVVGGGVQPSSGSLPAHPGTGVAGVAELRPELTIMQAGQVRQLGADATFSEAAGGWTLRTSNLQVNAGALAFAAAAVSSAHDLILAGGQVAAVAGWSMAGNAQISGNGAMTGALAGGATNAINASGGTLELGDSSNASGFSFGGTINIANGATLLLKDANGAALNAGGTLNAAGNATVDGKFINNGAVNGPTGAGQALTFVDDVSGAGNTSGNIVYSDGYAPGASPAAITHTGNLTFDATSDLEIELFGTTPGSEHDQINVTQTLDIEGLVRVVLGGGFDPEAGDFFDIFTALDIDLTGADFELPDLDPGLVWQSQVVGGANETYRLSVAPLLVAAPEPGSLAAILGALPLLIALRRRRAARV